MTLRSTAPYAIMIVLLILLPLACFWIDNMFLLSLASRGLILAAAAVSLNLIMGYGGLISFGQAVFIGIGGYVVGIGSHYAFANGTMWLTHGVFQLVLVLVLSVIASLFIGIVSLRTKGIYFLMITLAIGQMFYLAAVGAYQYGGDDGMTVFVNSRFFGQSLTGHLTLYVVSAIYLVGCVILVARLSLSRFGLVLRAAKINEDRALAMGYDAFRVRLVAFVIAGVMAGGAGFLMANHAGFVSPAMLHWTRSADLIVMVVLGGIGSVFGPLIGVVAFLTLEEILSGITEYWAIPVGAILVLIALFAPKGLAGLSNRGQKND